MSAPQAEAASEPRAVAHELLQAVLRRRLPLDEQLAGHRGLAGLEPRDRAFVRALLGITLRRLGRIDAVLARCLERPLPARAAGIEDLLRLGLAQLLFLRVPAHAAVDTTVRLAAARGGEAGFKGLVNAVLRRVAREREALLAATAEVPNLPGWLIRSWQDAYGATTAAAIAAAVAEEPPLDLSVKGDPAAWAEPLGATLLPTGTLRRPAEAGGAIEALPGFDEGAWWVQDAAAALPVRLLGPVAGRRVADLCAAPGGKTAQLAAAGALVTAVDRSGPRLARVAANLRRLGLSAELVEADAAAWRAAEALDAVLLDAPCSATGTLRRHPDIAWLKRPADIAKLAALQDRLLAAAVADLAPGGMLVFCTCSLQPEEGPQRVAALIAGGAPVVRRPIAPEELAGAAELLTPEGDLRTLPCHWAAEGGLDGFYAARLERRPG
jgi:16S rRNA (cytosine967-C5)-methyltransferase